MLLIVCYFYPGSQDKIVSLLAHIKAQNDMILSILQERDNHTKHTLKPDFKFPLKTLEELEAVENVLTMEENYANVVSFKFDDAITPYNLQQK
jgi:hypothetical protein